MPALHRPSLLASPIGSRPSGRQGEYADRKGSWERQRGQEKNKQRAVGRHITPSTVAMTMQRLNSSSQVVVVQQRRRVRRHDYQGFVRHAQAYNSISDPAEPRRAFSRCLSQVVLLRQASGESGCCGLQITVVRAATGAGTHPSPPVSPASGAMARLSDPGPFLGLPLNRLLSTHKQSHAAPA
jgi:hypothetical protein